MTSKDPAHDAPITHDKYEDGFRDGLNRALKIIDSKRGAFRDGSFRDSSIAYIKGWTRSNEAIKKDVSKLKGETE